MLLFPFSICSMFQMFPKMFLSLVSNTRDHLAMEQCGNSQKGVEKQNPLFYEVSTRISPLYHKFQHRLVWYLKLSSLPSDHRSKCLVITCWGPGREKRLFNKQAIKQTVTEPTKITISQKNSISLTIQHYSQVYFGSEETISSCRWHLQNLKHP